MYNHNGIRGKETHAAICAFQHAHTYPVVTQKGVTDFNNLGRGYIHVHKHTYTKAFKQ